MSKHRLILLLGGSMFILMVTCTITNGPSTPSYFEDFLVALDGSAPPDDWDSFCTKLESHPSPEVVYNWLGPRPVNELRAIISCLAHK